MIIIPAIDLKGGKAVRLEQGEMDRDTVYSDSPAEMAMKWEEGGAALIHLVDLDGAIDGKPANLSVIEEIVETVQTPVEIGGGIRDRATAEAYLKMAAVERIILGTIAHEDPDFVKGLAGEHPGRIAVGIDAKGGFVATKGWVNVTDVRATDLAKSFEDAGVACIIYTDIARDGMLVGPNVEATIDLAASIDIPVIASGGVGSIDCIRALNKAQHERKVHLEGVIVGKALYSGAIDLRRAIIETRETLTD